MGWQLTEVLGQTVALKHPQGGAGLARWQAESYNRRDGCVRLRSHDSHRLHLETWRWLRAQLKAGWLLVVEKETTI